MTEGGVLYRTIVVGFDGSERGNDALVFAAVLAKATGARVVAACVYPHQTAGPWAGEDDWLRFLRADAEQTLALASQTGVLEPDRLETEAIQASSPAKGLHDLAAQLAADLIVVGSSHRSRAGEVVGGSVPERLMHGAPCPVAVACTGLDERGFGAIDTIAVGFDGSLEALHALEGAAALAEATGAGIRLVVVAEPAPRLHARAGPTAAVAELEQAIGRYMEEQLDAGLASVPAEHRTEGAVLTGDPVERLREAAAEADVLVLGSRGYGPLRSVLLGSVSAPLVRSSPCTVIVYPRGVEPAGEDEPERHRSAVS